MRRSKLLRLRALMELAAESLNDKDALDGAELYPVWVDGASYRTGQRVRYQGTLYRGLQAHSAQTGWEPANAPSLWTRVLIEASDTVPMWVQPESTNPYGKGDRVSHNGKVWVSVVDGNVWEPGVYGWEEEA